MVRLDINYRQKWCVAVAVVIVFLVCSKEFGWAQTNITSLEWAGCKYGNPKDIIKGCNRILEKIRTRKAKTDRLYEAFLERGQALAQLARCPEADADFVSAFANFPSNAEKDPENLSRIYYFRSWAAELCGDKEKAKAIIAEGISKIPDHPRLFTSKADLEDSFDAAVSDYDTAFRLEKDRSNLWRWQQSKAVLYLSARRPDEALAILDEASRTAPKNHQTELFGRAIAWRLKGDLVRSEKYYNEILGSRPLDAFARVGRADILRYRGEYKSAIALYREAIKDYNEELDRGFPTAFVGLGLAYERLGDQKAARQAFQKAIERAPEFEPNFELREARNTARARLAAFDVNAPSPRILPVPAVAEKPFAILTPQLGEISAPAESDKLIASRRVALVIGNSAYSVVSALRNPKNDAEAMARSLRSIGFETVTLTSDATREQLINALRSFANEAEKADWAVVYYAGHGMEVGGTNYLVPVDAKLAVDRDIQFEAVPLDQVLAAVDSAKKLKLVILDACRDNPFQTRKTTAPEATARATGGSQIASRTIGRGLAEVKVTGATLVVYAAKNGQVALDGEGDNSPFAVAVVQRLATPGIEINKLFRLVRDDVMEATAGRQEPYTYGSLPGREDFFFVSR